MNVAGAGTTFRCRSSDRLPVLPATLLRIWHFMVNPAESAGQDPRWFSAIGQEKRHWSSSDAAPHGWRDLERHNNDFRVVRALTPRTPDQAPRGDGMWTPFAGVEHSRIWIQTHQTAQRS